MEQISRKNTQIKIHVYCKNIITQPIQTFLNLGNGICLILLSLLHISINLLPNFLISENDSFFNIMLAPSYRENR